jgi:hypothetical protein
MSFNLVQLASDNFTRANENPLSDSGLWAAPISPYVGLEIVSHLCQSAAATSSTASGQFFNGALLSSDQYASFTIATTNGSDAMSVEAWVRATEIGGGITISGYELVVGCGSEGAGGSIELNVISTGGSFTNLFHNTPYTVSEGDVWTIAAISSYIYVIQNGSIVVLVQDETLSSGGVFYALDYDLGSQSALQLSNVAIGVIPTISGNAGVAGATVSYTGASSGLVIAGAGGAFSISGLPAGSYTITPSLAGYAFSPTSRNVTLSTTNVTGVNFTATQTTLPSSRFTFLEAASPAPGATVYEVIDGASTNSLGRTIAGTGKKVGQIFFDAVVAQAWSFYLQDNQPNIAAGSTDAADIESFATSLAIPAGIIVQPGPTPSTRFAFTAVQTRNGQPVLKYLVSDGPSIAFGSVAQIVWDGVFARWIFAFTNDSARIESPADVACIHILRGVTRAHFAESDFALKNRGLLIAIRGFTLY